MVHRIMSTIVLAAGALALAAPALAGETITLASTTSTEQSGLFRHLLPQFERATGIAVRVLALGTGQALDVGRRGDADVLLVHDRAAEDRFVADGYGAYRRDVMFNDFVVIGPRADPARVAAAAEAGDAFRRIARAAAPFVSRGDRSGTHAAERRLWEAAGTAPKGSGWYKEVGAGMGPTLNMAAELDAYTLADRGTWAAFKNRRGLAIVHAGDPRLNNPYGAILVNPRRHPHVRRAAAERFIDWLTSEKGRRAIAAYRVGGEQLFFPPPATGR
jgi:tungstate transport system substrate-binding protein